MNQFAGTHQLCSYSIPCVGHSVKYGAMDKDMPISDLNSSLYYQGKDRIGGLILTFKISKI